MSEFGSKHFLNRELSWLAFNQRVLDEAMDPKNPLLERVKFFCIFGSNLDEFFEVRVAGLKQEIESDVVTRSLDGLTASETLRVVQKRVRQLCERHAACWRDQLVPSLTEQGIHILKMTELEDSDVPWLEQYYRAEVRPVLTPLGIDPAHPFPHLLNKSVYLMVELAAEPDGHGVERRAIVQVPPVLPRLVRLPRENTVRAYAQLSHIIGHYLADLFPGNRIAGHWRFRVTRNSELYIDVEEEASVLRAVEKELHNRRRGDAVRLEVERDCPVAICTFLRETLHLDEDDLYVIDGPLNPTRLIALCSGDHSPELRDPPYVAPEPAALRGQADLFAAIRAGDRLMHHPYETFDSVVDLLQQAAEDPHVLAIKQTLYRTGGDARIMSALITAARNGKQVTAVVELKARFDEENNIQWARALEQAGVHVVYGLVGYKIHAKMALIVRRDDDGIRRYVHLGTGNYNATTARIYTDLGLLTARPDISEDVTNLFNILTGLCQFQGAHKLLIAPFELHGRILTLIRNEADNARKGLPARIIAKMNALVDQEVIEELYRASQVGVTIDLIVRGICCLRPGVRGVSERITVRSVVDRFLEHSRIFYFENGLNPKVYLGSADWMPRNFFGRIEVVFPVDDGNARERIIHELLTTYLADNAKARLLRPDGTYAVQSPKRGQTVRRCQNEFMQKALAVERPTDGSRRRGRSGIKVQVAPRPKKLDAL